MVDNDGNDIVIVDGIDILPTHVDLELTYVDVTIEQWGMCLADGVLYVKDEIEDISYGGC